MGNELQRRPKSTVGELKKLVADANVKANFKRILGERGEQFLASIVNVTSSNTLLAKCEPASIMSAAFIAATLDLPIDPNLGRAYIIPYGGKAQFQMGYKGFVELAIRTNQYKTMHATEVYEDEILDYNPIFEELRFAEDFSLCTQRASGQRDKIVGYYAYYELLSGFRKGLYMTKAEVESHAKRYSKTYNNGPWQTHFDEMAKKTVIKLLLSKWAMLSIQVRTAIEQDQKVFDGNTGSYEDNRPDVDAVDAAANAVEAKIAAEVTAEEQKAPEKKQEPAQETKPAPAAQQAQKAKPAPAEPEATPEDFDFDAFDKQFEQGELPFK